MEIGDNMSTELQTKVLTADDLVRGDTLRSLELPEGSLVMMVRRGTGYKVPDGKLKLLPGDTLLIIKESRGKNRE